jgi:hypothetical protein
MSIGIKRREIRIQKEGVKMDRFLRSKTPIFIAAGMSFLLSVYLWFSGFKEEGIFVGLWVPSILSLGAFFYSGRDVK